MKQAAGLTIHGRAAWPLAALALVAVLALTLALGARAAMAGHGGGHRFVATTGSDTDNDCATVETPCLTVAHAVSEAVAGDVIEIAAGEYAGATSISDLEVTIQGQGALPADVVLSGGDTERVIAIAAGTEVTLVNLTVTLGNTPAEGGGIRNEGDLTLTDVVVSGNYADTTGGGIYNDGTLTVQDGVIVQGNEAFNDGGGIYNTAAGTVMVAASTISENEADAFSGGAIFNNGTVSIVGSTLADNEAGENGGAIYNNGAAAELSIASSTLSGNVAKSRDGGAIANIDGSVTIEEGSVLSGNQARDDAEEDFGRGGAIFATGNNASVTINGGSISNNTADEDGGGIAVVYDGLDPSPLSVTITGGAVISDNTATWGSGGGVFVESPGALFVDDEGGAVVISGNSAIDSDGGGIYASTSADGAIEIAGATISGNDALRGGGGLSLFVTDGAVATISDTTIEGNDSGEEGGGIAAMLQDAALTITDGAIRLNTAVDAGGGGYFLLDNSMLTTTGVEVADNEAAAGGGLNAIVQTNSVWTIDDSTITENDALGAEGTDGTGGGLQFGTSGGGRVEMDGATISGNTAVAAGGGILALLEGDGLQIVDSAILNNTAGVGAALSGGGGVYVTGGQAALATALIFGTAIHDNDAGQPPPAGGGGGGIAVHQLGSGVAVTVSRSSFAGNTYNDDPNAVTAFEDASILAHDNWWGCDDLDDEECDPGNMMTGGIVDIDSWITGVGLSSDLGSPLDVGVAVEFTAVLNVTDGEDTEPLDSNFTARFTGDCIEDGSLETAPALMDLYTCTVPTDAEVTAQAVMGGVLIDGLVSNTVALTFDAGPPDPGASTVVADPTSLPANGVATTTITVTVRDNQGNPLAGHDVILDVEEGDPDLEMPDDSSESDVDGIATFTVRGFEAVTVVFTATIQGDPDIDILQTVEVDFTEPSTVAELNALSLSGGATLTPAFDAGTFAYTSSVANSVTSLTVTATAIEGGTVQVSGNTGFVVGGGNVITVTVTAEDGGTTQDYTITVTRAAPPPVDDTPPDDTPAPPSGPVAEPVVEREDEVVAAVVPDAPAVVVTQASNGGTATVAAPANALPAGATLTAAAVTNIEALVAQAPPPAGAAVALAFVVEATGAGGDAITEDFAEPVDLEFTVPAASVPAGTESGELVVAFWNGSAWVEVDAVVTVNADGSFTIVASVDHFTIFSVMHQPGRGSFSPAPASAGVSLTVWGGGGYGALTSTLGSGESVWTFVGGIPLGFTSGAPEFVNARFVLEYPAGLPAGTLVVTVR